MNGMRERRKKVNEPLSVQVVSLVCVQNTEYDAVATTTFTAACTVRPYMAAVKVSVHATVF